MTDNRTPLSFEAGAFFVNGERIGTVTSVEITTSSEATDE
jgi:hypothetical protein